MSKAYDRGPIDYTQRLTGFNVATWFVCQPAPSALCRLGVHLPSRLRAEGWIGFSQVLRVRCDCATREWVVFDGYRDKADVIDPARDAQQREEFEAMEGFRRANPAIA